MKVCITLISLFILVSSVTLEQRKKPVKKKTILYETINVVSNYDVQPGDDGISQVLTADEQELYRLIMEYRKKKGLPAIPISKSLTTVAHIHVQDLSANFEINNSQGCNIHSWSDKGNWTPCCYTSDHAQAACMWKKPKELTPYFALGYEISYYSGGGATPKEAFESWEKSSGHNDVIINQDIWKGHTWRAIGIGIYKNYAVVWFGDKEDN